jgi:anthranilate phosphoribosyltransferase
MSRSATPVPEPDPNFWPGILSRLAAREDLSTRDAHAAMRVIMEGQASPALVGGFLMALRTKGESVDEIVGLAEATRELAQPVVPPAGATVVDTCGTGGDRAGTLNVSTLGAIVAAGAGAVVAKHGNRAASSRCGSADLLEALGVRIDLGPAGVERCLADAGIAFMFAPVFHPAVAHAMPIRRELRVPTVFNFLGPLTNPARPAAQVVGVSDPAMLPKVAGVLAARGTRAWVVRGADGLDELTTTGPSTLFDVADGEASERTFHPEEAGLSLAGPGDLRGGDVEENVGIARSVLAGDPGPRRDVVLLTAAAALLVAGLAADLVDGVAKAAAAIDEGRAAETLDRWVAASDAAAAG